MKWLAKIYSEIYSLVEHVIAIENWLKFKE